MKDEMRMKGGKRGRREPHRPTDQVRENRKRTFREWIYQRARRRSSQGKEPIRERHSGNGPIRVQHLGSGPIRMANQTGSDSPVGGDD